MTNSPNKIEHMTDQELQAHLDSIVERHIARLKEDGTLSSLKSQYEAAATTEEKSGFITNLYYTMRATIGPTARVVFPSVLKHIGVPDHWRSWTSQHVKQ